MYYRRKMLLSLLEIYNGSLSNTEFQKLLFLWNKKLPKPQFWFVPYKYGCFSFQSYADKRTLTKYGFIKDLEQWEILSLEKTFFNELSEEDRLALINLQQEFPKPKKAKLIREVYLNYPYFAINSEIVNDVLTKTEYIKVLEMKPKDVDQTLFTIGYEGKSIDEFADLLIRNNVKVLCDVRKNALSMKYGFSKNQLKGVVESLNIKYIHIPELGILSKDRKGENIDFTGLFKRYRQELTQHCQKAIKSLEELLLSDDRVAIMCFEYNECDCHRGEIARYFRENLSFPVASL